MDLTGVPTGTAKSWPGCIEPHRIPKPEVSWYPPPMNGTQLWAAAAAASACAFCCAAASVWACA